MVRLGLVTDEVNKMVNALKGPAIKTGGLQPIASKMPQNKVSSGQPKITPTTLQPVQSAQTTVSAAPGAGVAPVTQSSSQPTTEDLLNEMKKLSLEQTQAQQEILRQDTGDIVSQLNKAIYGRNIAPEGGLGTSFLQDAVKDQQTRLEPVAMGIAADTAKEGLRTKMSQDWQKTQNAFSLAKTGQLKGTEYETALKNMGLTNVGDFLSDDEADMARFAISQGYFNADGTPDVQAVIDVKRRIAELQQKDILAHPERYADLAKTMQEIYQPLRR